MTILLKMLLSMSIASVILIPLVWFLKKVFGQFLTKRKSYYVWSVVFFFLIVPFAFFFVQKDTEFLWGAPSEFAGLTSMVIGQNGIEVERSTQAVIFQFILDYVWVLWLIVGLIMLVYRMASYRNFKKYVISGARFMEEPDELDILAEAMETIRLDKPVEVMVNPLISSPVFLGFRREIIVLPSTSFSQKELYHIFLHELVHCKSKDMYVVFLAQIFTCIYWFNPLMYWMNKQLERDREYACDESVLPYLPAQDALSYGDTLLHSVVKSGTYKESHAAVSLHENAKMLKERLEAIASYKKGKSGYIAFFLLLILLSSIGILLNFYEAKAFVYEKKQGIEIKKEDTSKKTEFRAIDLQNTNQDVTIRKGKTESFDLTTYDKNSQAKLVVKNGVLMYQNANPNTQATIDITIDADKVYDSLSIQTTGTQIKISDIQTKTMRIKGGVIIAHFNHIKTDTMNVTTGSANVHVTDSEVHKGMEFNGNNALIHFEKSNFNNLEMTSFISAKLNDLNIRSGLSIHSGGQLDARNITADTLKLVAGKSGNMKFQNTFVKKSSEFQNDGSMLLQFDGVLNGQTRMSIGPSQTKFVIRDKMQKYAIDAQSSQADTFLLNKRMVNYPLTQNLSAPNSIKLTNESPFNNNVNLSFE